MTNEQRLKLHKLCAKNPMNHSLSTKDVEEIIAISGETPDGGKLQIDTLPFSKRQTISAILDEKMLDDAVLYHSTLGKLLSEIKLSKKNESWIQNKIKYDEVSK